MSDQKDLEKYQAMFKEIDSNKDGFIQYEELKAYTEKKGEKCCEHA